MKTLKDLEEMKNKKVVPFGNKYDYLFAYLEDCYIAKSSGLARIKHELDEWDEESKMFIKLKLIDMIVESGMMDFNPNEIISL